MLPVSVVLLATLISMHKSVLGDLLQKLTFQLILRSTKTQVWLPSLRVTNTHRQPADSRESTVQISSDSHRKRNMSLHSAVKRSPFYDCTHLPVTQSPLSQQTKSLFFPQRLLLLPQWWLHSQYFLDSWLKKIKYVRYGKL